MCLCLRPCLSPSGTLFAWTCEYLLQHEQGQPWAVSRSMCYWPWLPPSLYCCLLPRAGHWLWTSWPHLKGPGWDLRANPPHFNNFFLWILLFFSVTQSRSNTMLCWNSFSASLSAIISKVICFLCGPQSICEFTRLAPASQPSPVHSCGEWIFSFRLCPPVLLPPASGARPVSSHGDGSRWRNHGGEH